MSGAANAVPPHSASFRLVRLNRAGNLLVARSPERMLFAAVLIRIGFRGNALTRCALALFERVRVGGHEAAFRVFDLALPAGAFRALLRRASLRSIGTPCFFSTSAKASPASS